MRPFQDIPVGTLEWVQPERFRRDFELRSGSEVLATLTWSSAFGSQAWGRHAGGAFSFKRAGFLNPYVTVRESPSGSDIARLLLGRGGQGTLVFPDGRRYDFLRWGFWSPTWGFQDVYGRGLCRFAPYHGFGRTGAWVHVDAPPVAVSDLPLLVLVGWYSIRLREEEEAADAGAATASAAAAAAIVST